MTETGELLRHRSIQDRGKKLAVGLYKKVVDRNTYLHFKSFNSQTLRQNIPYGQFLHIRRNSTNLEQFKKYSSKMQEDFIQRGYPVNLVSDAAEKARLRDRLELLQLKEPSETFKGITAAIDYTPQSFEIKSIIHKHWHLVNDILGCRGHLRIVQRKMKSIKDYVTRSDIREKQVTHNIVKGNFKCGGCSSCHQAWVTKRIELPSANFTKEIEFFSIMQQ